MKFIILFPLCKLFSTCEHTWDEVLHLDLLLFLLCICRLHHHYDKALFLHTLNLWNLPCLMNIFQNQNRMRSLARLWARHRGNVAASSMDELKHLLHWFCRRDHRLAISLTNQSHFQMHLWIIN